MSGEPPATWPGTEHQVRRHRAPRSATGNLLAAAGTRLGIGALLIAAMAIGGVVKSYTPDTDTRERPFVRSGAPGARVDARTFEATVLGVRGAPRVTRSGKTYGTGGVWILVRLRLVAHVEPTSVGHATVIDRRGRTYSATERFSQPLTGGHQLQPDIPAEGEIVFEVPRDAAPGLAVQLASNHLDQRMDALAEISLDIDRAKVDGWLGSDTPAKLEDAEVAG